MAENLIQLESVSLDSGYVFYNRLQNSNARNFQTLYSTVRSRMSEAFLEATRLKASTDKLLSQAQNERNKEIALLRRQFGVNISLDYTNPQGTLEFIDIFNKYMNIEGIYERNKQLILKTKGQKSVISFFPTYLKQELDATWKDAMANFDFSTEDTLNNDIVNWLEESIPRAIERMFNAERETLSIDPELQNVYQQLLGAIGEVKSEGSFSQQLASIYKLDEIANAIQKEISAGVGSKQKLSSISKKCKISARKGGLSLEAFYDLITATLQEATGGKGGHAVIGSKGGRADNVATFGIDLSPVINQIENFTGQLTREKAVDLFNQIDTSLNTEEGFIVYTSDKNYTLNDGFVERGGFQGGANIDMISLEALLKKAGYNAKTFIGAILQLAEGAVGDDKSPVPFEEALAKMIANFLFDDYNAIGAGLTNSTNALHIMNLNGILIPISSILFALADSINNVIALSPRSIVDIRIHSTPIEFKTQEEQWNWQLSNNQSGSGAWNYQRDQAHKNTEISIHFMASLKSMLQNAYFR